MIKLKTSLLSKILLLYCYIPVFLFMIGWVNTYISIPLVLLLAYIMWKFCTNIEEDNDCIEIHKWEVVVYAFICSVFCMLLGMGNIFPQSGDYFKHNGALHDLVQYSWPVIYTKHEKSMLTYYIGQYLLPAMVGKIVGSVAVSEIMMALWNIVGVFLVCLSVFSITRCNTMVKRCFVMFLLFLFSGMLHPLQQLIEFLYPSSYIYDLHSIRANGMLLENRSLLIQLQWAPNQCITMWMSCLLLYKYREQSRYLSLYILPLLLTSTWSFLTMFIYVAVGIVYDALREQLKIKELFSWENISLGLFFGIIILVYLLGNVMQEKPSNIGFSFAISSWKDLSIAVIFSVFMFGAYYLVVPMRHVFRNILFVTSVVLLFLIPMFSMGLFNDFVSCCSMPAIFYTYLFVSDYLCNSEIPDKKRWSQICILLIIVISIPFSIIVIRKQIHMPSWQYYSVTLCDYTDRDNNDIPIDCKYNYFTYDVEESVFYKYLARK